MASKCKFPYILTVRLRARKPTIKIVGFLARKFYKLFLFISNDLPIIINCHTKLPVTRSIATFSTPFLSKKIKTIASDVFIFCVFQEFLVDIYGSR